MIEYIGNIIKLDQGVNEIIANITDDSGEPINTGCSIEIDNQNTAGTFDGSYWHFVVDTKKKETGKYCYRIFKDETAISFNEPLYIVGCEK